MVCETSVHTGHYCELDGYDYLRCERCSLIYIDRVEKTEAIYKAYNGSALKSLRRRMLAPFRKFHHDRKFDYSVKRASDIFTFAADQVSRPGKYLDIGCNKCYLLAQGLEKGWDVYGCELVPEVTAPFLNTYKKCRDHVFQGRFMDVRPKFASNTFHLITAIDVIEHFEDVISDLKGVLDILKPGGSFVIQTPDVDSVQARQDGCGWEALKPLEHLHLFNLANLTKLAKRVGFSEVVGVAEPFEESCGNFSAVLKK